MKKLHEQLKLQSDIEVPYHVWTCFGEKSKVITLAGDQASLGEDYKKLDELRKALDWYVNQLGGQVKWGK